MDLAKEEESWGQILATVKQVVREGFPDALEYILKARVVALHLYDTHVQMRSRLLVDLAVLIELEAVTRGVVHDVVKRADSKTSKVYSSDS